MGPQIVVDTRPAQSETELRPPFLGLAPSPELMAIQRVFNHLEHIAALSPCSNEADVAAAKAKTDVSIVLSYVLTACSEREINAFLTELDQLVGSVLAGDKKKQWLSSVLSCQDTSVSPALSCLLARYPREIALSTIERFLFFGANPDSFLMKTESEALESQSVLRGDRALHIAARRRDCVLAVLLREYGANLEAENTWGVTPLGVGVSQGSAEETAESHRFFKMLGAGPVPALAGLLRKKSYEPALRLLELEPELDAQQRYELYRGGKLEAVSREEFVRELFLVLNQIGEEAECTGLGRQIFSQVFSSSQQLLHVYQYAMAARAFVKHPAAEPRAVTDILPFLLHHYEPAISLPLFAVVERHMDMHRRSWGRHPHEAEMMAALNHPRIKIFAGDPTTAALTRSLTSITRFLKYSVDLPPAIARNWARVGVLTFSFPLWKFEAMHLGGATLFEEYGFHDRVRFVPGPERSFFGRRKPYPFGATYVLKPFSREFTYRVRDDQGRGKVVEKQFDDRTLLVFARGYILASHPLHGTLLIRNSSWEFGRDLLEHPAYWCDAGINGGFELEDLLDPRRILPKMKHMLHLEINKRHPRCTESIAYLLEQLGALREDFAAYKFDTRDATAWDRSAGRARLKGGYRSPGFKSFVEKIDAYVKQHGFDSAPRLVFIARKSLPFAGIHYRLNGESSSQLPLTGPRLRALKALAEGKNAAAQLAATGLQAFFQEAGFNHPGSELTLVSDQIPLDRRTI